MRGGKVLMADYCKQCSIKWFGEDFHDLAGMSTAEDTRKGMYAVVICEGCGYVLVDHEGTCVSTNCPEGHGGKDGE